MKLYRNPKKDLFLFGLIQNTSSAFIPLRSMWFNSHHLLRRFIVIGQAKYPSYRTNQKSQHYELIHLYASNQKHHLSFQSASYG
jgi:hypothetical protein